MIGGAIGFALGAVAVDFDPVIADRMECADHRADPGDTVFRPGDRIFVAVTVVAGAIWPETSFEDFKVAAVDPVAVAAHGCIDLRVVPGVVGGAHCVSPQLLMAFASVAQA